jgi:hypothetical protein
MDDSLVSNPGSGGYTFASDEIAGVEYPKSKLVYGPNDTATNVTTSTPWPIQLRNTSGTEIGTNAAPVQIGDAGGSITVDGSVSATVSGTVAATQSGTWNIAAVTDITNVVSVDDNAGSLTVDDGGTSLTVDGTVAATQSGTWTLGANSGVDIGDVTINNAAGVSAVNIQDGGNSITVDGTVAATQSGTWNIGTVTTITNVVHVDDNSSSLTVDDGGSSITVDGTITATSDTSATATISNVSGSASSVTILASNASRKKALVYNDSTAILYLLFGTGTASATNFSEKLFPEDSYELDVPVFTGQLTGVWASATGAARVTELT